MDPVPTDWDLRLKKAVRRGDWDATRRILNDLPPDMLTARITARITLTGGTILHVAVAAQKENIVQNLLAMMSEHELVIQDNKGYTALHEAIYRDNSRIAGFLYTRNNRLIRIRTFSRDLPVVMAMRCGHKQLASYLYRLTPFGELQAEQGHQGSVLLTYAIYARDVGFARVILDRSPSLAFAVHQENLSPLNALATFQTKNQLTIWEIKIHRLMVRLADHNQPGRPGFCSAFMISNQEALGRDLENNLYQELLRHICTEIPTFTPSQVDSTIAPAIFCAISRGNYEFVSIMLEANPEFLWIQNSEGMNIFHCAVLHRQAKICSLIYKLEGVEALLAERDKSGNTILHLAGMLTEYTAIDQIAGAALQMQGAALQMQREVQWFKEMERICPPMFKELRNEHHLSPRELFTESHKELRKQGEQWIKGTATSCTVVGALVVTIMFPVAFSILGGNNQDTGFPILMHGKLFRLFMVTDSLSLFSSSTSVLVFLKILISRYAEEDFLKSLPKMMIIGLSALFCSVTTMMIAFSIVLLLIFHEQYLTIAPIIGVAGIPIILFMVMQFGFLVDMFVLTYGPGIFGRKMML